MRAIGYILTTGTGPAEENPDYQEQYSSISSYCNDHDHNLVKVFEDSLERGNSRPGYLALLEFIDAPNQASIIIVAESSQLGSSLEQAIATILRVDRAGSTVVCSSTEYPDPIQNALNFFRLERSEQIREAMLQKALDGKALGRPAYGYEIAETGALAADPAESVTVRRIFDMYLTSRIGLRKIAESLNASNILGRNSSQWTIARILGILKNPVYIGTYRRFGLRIPNNHEPLISTGDFTSTQQLMRSRKTYKSKRQVHIYPLSGILSCLYCDGKMIGFSRKQSWRRKDGSRNQKTYRYYYCPHRLENPLCKSNVSGAEPWEEVVAASLFDYLSEHPEQRIVSATSQEGPIMPINSEARSGLTGHLQRRWMKALRLTATGSLTLGDLRRITSDLEYLNAGIDEERHASITQLLQIEDLELWSAISLLDQKTLFGLLLSHVLIQPSRVRLYLNNGDEWAV